MNKSIFILLLSLITCRGYAQSIPPPQHFITDKNPGMSFTLSAILPGAGEMYNDQVTLGLIVFPGDIALITGGSIMSGSQFNAVTQAFGETFIIAGGILYVAQLVYAPLYSQHLNKKNGFQSMNLELKGSQLSLSLKF